MVKPIYRWGKLRLRMVQGDGSGMQTEVSSTSVFLI